MAFKMGGWSAFKNGPEKKQSPKAPTAKPANISRIREEIADLEDTNEQIFNNQLSDAKDNKDKYQQGVFESRIKANNKKLEKLRYNLKGLEVGDADDSDGPYGTPA